MIKKVLLFLSVIGVVYGQQPAATAPVASTPPTTATPAGTDSVVDLKDPISRLQRYMPKNSAGLDEDPAKMKRDYELIKRIVADSKTKFAPIVASYADYGAALYFDSYATHVRDDYSFEASPNYYESTKSSVARTDSLYRDIAILERGLKKFKELRTDLGLLGIASEELNAVDTDISKLLATMYVMKGTVNDMRRAKNTYLYLLGIDGQTGLDVEENLIIKDPKERKDFYNLLLGVNTKLMEIERNDIWKREETRDNLFYLWKITELNANDNEKLKENRFTLLLKEYAHYVDIRGMRFDKYYKTYYEALAKSDIELADRLNEISKAATTIAAPTAPAPGTVAPGTPAPNTPTAPQ